MYLRIIKKEIVKKLFKGKAILLIGPRQVGKTTLAKEILQEKKRKKRVFNCDNPTDRDVLSGKDLDFLVDLIGDAEIVLIDEGQKVETIGQTLKLLVDHFGKKKQIIVTGSSSFNLLDKTGEVLTGRKFVFELFPLSLEELHLEKDLLKIKKETEKYLIYGNYPGIINQKSFADKKTALEEITMSYLYKDILEFQQVKSSRLIRDLVRALALQIGSEVSYNELANLLGIDKKTVERYIDLLEKNFIVFQLTAYSKNKRREISRLKKVYFYDLGIRNASINNFNFLDSRNDGGQLWENFLAVERLKYQKYHNIYASNYFWRTYDGSEVDWVEEREGKIFGYEFKFNDRKRPVKTPSKWSEYKNSEFRLITPRNITNFII